MQHKQPGNGTKRPALSRTLFDGQLGYPAPLRTFLAFVMQSCIFVKLAPTLALSENTVRLTLTRQGKQFRIQEFGTDRSERYTCVAQRKDCALRLYLSGSAAFQYMTVQKVQLNAEEIFQKQWLTYQTVRDTVRVFLTLCKGRGTVRFYLGNAPPTKYLDT